MKTTKILKISSVLAIVLMISALFFTGCTTPNNNSIQIHYDYPVSLGAEEMAEMADFVVIGKYEKLEKTWNMRRDINDVTKESETDYVEGRLYRFTVSEVVKGDFTESSILVNHRYIERINLEKSDAVIDETGIIVKPATKTEIITLNIQDSLYIEPEIGGTYMLFLSKDSNFGNYYGATEPFMVKIENDKAILQSNLIDKKGDFSSSVKARNGDLIEVKIGAVSIKDTVTGMTLEELKAAIK
ncbi:MAG: cardiolipin synthase [Ruminococcaceae bacterium]|nr:cardiolipin synthase [Oscillospiraceae bacterium]